MSFFNFPKIDNRPTNDQAVACADKLRNAPDRGFVLNPCRNEIAEAVIADLRSAEEKVEKDVVPVLPKAASKLISAYISVAKNCLNKGLFPPMIILSGYEGVGKHTVLRYLASQLGMTLASASSKAFSSKSFIVADNAETAQKIYSQKEGAAVALVVHDKVHSSLAGSYWEIFDPSTVKADHIAVRVDETEYDEVAEELLCSIAQANCVSLSADDKIAILASMVAIDADISPYNISYLMQRAVARSRNTGKSAADCLIHVADELRAGRKPDIAADILKPRKTMDDLVVDRTVKKAVEQIIVTGKHLNKAKTYAFANKNRLGRSLKCLFYGPPGTGKSVMAEVIASELGKDLWVADVSRIEGKFVGESEKNLKKLFRRAEASQAVLFLDECDGLLANRATGASEHQISLMSLFLQLVQDFKGVLILATNFKTALDPATDRRLLYQVHFDLPSDENAGKIIENLLTPDAPLAAKVDFVKAVGGLGLSGGHLVNIVESLHAMLIGNKIAEISQDLIRAEAEEIARRGSASRRKLGFEE